MRELLWQDANFDERLLKYANDLVFIDWTNESTVGVHIVLRLPVPISKGENNTNRRRKTKRMQQLLHPLPLGIPCTPDNLDMSRKEAMRIAHMFDPIVWWHPNIRYGLLSVETGIYGLTKLNSHGEPFVKGRDDFCPPFAFFRAPHATLRPERVVPKLHELKMFAEGMTIGGQQLHFFNPNPDFMRWTYENHIAAPVEIGQKVEAKVESGMIQGIVNDIFLDEVTLRISNTEEMGVDLHWVRRI